MIESLRLELAESQIKLVEMENKGGGRQRELEKELLEARMANARLMEDNESYQLLLSERTLNGDFAKGEFMRELHPDTPEPSEAANDSGNNLGSLAEELESMDAKAETDHMRKLETEVRTLKDQNKALTLYIERIISRVLQHEGFETILDKNENDPPANAKPKNTSTEKDLPQPLLNTTIAEGSPFLKELDQLLDRTSPRPNLGPVQLALCNHLQASRQVLPLLTRTQIPHLASRSTVPNPYGLATVGLDLTKQMSQPPQSSARYIVDEIPEVQ